MTTYVIIIVTVSEYVEDNRDVYVLALMSFLALAFKVVTYSQEFWSWSFHMWPWPRVETVAVINIPTVGLKI